MGKNFQNKKIELIQWLSNLKDESIMDQIMRLRRIDREDWFTAISREESASLEQGLKDVDSGKLRSHSEVRKLYDRWL